MATKYQCEKIIKQLSGDPELPSHITGFGIGLAKHYDVEGETGYIVLIYTQDDVLPYAQNTKHAVDKAQNPEKNQPSSALISRLAKENSAALQSKDAQTLATTSRKLRIDVPVKYITTGKFSFE